MLKIRLSDCWLPACEVGFFFFFSLFLVAGVGWGVGGRRLTQQRGPLSFEWAAWDYDSAPVVGRARTSARRGVTRRVACPLERRWPLSVWEEKKKRDYHFWWSTFSQTAVINEKGRDRNCLTIFSYCVRVCLWCHALVVSAGETRVCILKSRVLHQKKKKKTAQGRRQEKFIMGCFNSQT